jgi:Holliday junction resolvasome RuvABC DNA-binding subunit
MIKEACEKSLTKAGNISFKTADRLILEMQRSQTRKSIGASTVNEDTKQREELREFLLNSDWTYHGKK